MTRTTSLSSSAPVYRMAHGAYMAEIASLGGGIKALTYNGEPLVETYEGLPPMCAWRGSCTMAKTAQKTAASLGAGLSTSPRQRARAQQRQPWLRPRRSLGSGLLRHRPRATHHPHRGTVAVAYPTHSHLHPRRSRVIRPLRGQRRRARPVRVRPAHLSRHAARLPTPSELTSPSPSTTCWTPGTCRRVR